MTPDTARPRVHTLRLKACVMAVVAVGVLSGCASLGGAPTVTADVASYGEWAATRKPGTYRFERLPSQQSRAEQQALLESAAAEALTAAGFQPAAADGEPAYVVQLGARSTRLDNAAWMDPFWWRGAPAGWRVGPGGTIRPWLTPVHPAWIGWPGWRHEPLGTNPTAHEVALLLRDKASGQPVYEARAQVEGLRREADVALVAALFRAALKDFPATGLNPRAVTVPLLPVQPAPSAAKPGAAAAAAPSPASPTPKAAP
jgi:hypothetical protein